MGREKDLKVSKKERKAVRGINRNTRQRGCRSGGEKQHSFCGKGKDRSGKNVFIEKEDLSDGTSRVNGSDSCGCAEGRYPYRTQRKN